MIVKKLTRLVFESALHLVAIAGIIILFWPLAQWYFEYKPLWGVDFFYTATLVNDLKNSFTIAPMSWGYAWFSGWPILVTYPSLQIYLIYPLTLFFDLLSAVKIWMLVSLALFFVGSYACFFVLSKNRVLSFLFSVAAIYSVGVYGTLMWGGSLPSHATQAFFPWTVFFVLAFLKSGSIKYLLTSAVLAGFAILGHPQIVIAYIYPAISILIFFSFGKIAFLNRIKSLIIFLTISFLIGLPVLQSSVGALNVLIVKDAHQVASSTTFVPSKESGDIKAFHAKQPERIFTDTNKTIFHLLIIAAIFFFATLLMQRKLKNLLDVLPFIILTAYFGVYIWIFGQGISIYHGGWYRLFWAPPFLLGLLAAVFWGQFYEFFNKILINSKFRIYLGGLVSLLILILGSYFLMDYSKDVKEKIIPRSNPSSAFPDILNLRAGQAGFEGLKKQLVPEWLDGDQTNYRLYGGDQTVNIWWNSLFKMPLSRGYLDPPVSAANRGYFFWLDASLSQETATGKDQLEGNFKYPKEVAFNNTLFLINWYAVKYFEAGHASPTAYAPIPKDLSTTAYMVREADLDFNGEKYNKGNQTLHYYELKDEFVEPILSSTNAMTLGIIATDSGYETIVRGLADMNKPSQQLIPIKLGNFIDKISSKELSQMDALVVYDYKYKDKQVAFRLLRDYLKKGKKVYFETGGEVSESSEGLSLPEIFPIETTERKPLGDKWNFQIENDDLTKDIDFSKFDPPIFDDALWNFSYPRQPSNLRSDSKIILKNQEKPLIISRQFEGGEIIWSGMNLPYHVIHFHNPTEIAFFKRVIEKLLPPSNQEKINYDVKFIDAQNREIRTKNAKGILFKEQAYSGWLAKVEANNQTQYLEIYKAGPAYPGFIYVRLPDEFIGSESKTTFIFKGSNRDWFVGLLSALIVIVVTEIVLFRGRFLGVPAKFAGKKIHYKVKGWWSKEDD